MKEETFKIDKKNFKIYIPNKSVGRASGSESSDQQFRKSKT